MADENREIVIIDDKTIKDKTYSIRGQKVMIDTDLAEIYSYKTKSFNQQVKKEQWKIWRKGIYMLMTVLGVELVVKQSKALIRIFKKMKDFICSKELLQINSMPVKLLSKILKV